MKLTIIEKLLWIVAGLSGALVAMTIPRCQGAPYEHHDTMERP